MGTAPSVRRQINDDGTDYFTYSGPTESQKRAGKKPVTVVVQASKKQPETQTKKKFSFKK